MDAHIGHDSQVARIEEHRLVGGKGEGLRLVEMTNGRGLDLTVVVDRCCDFSRLAFRGLNLGYFAPCGYVGPAYCDPVGNGFLRSFQAGFLTTCGFENVGGPCRDDGEDLPLHGSITGKPAENVRYWRLADALQLEADIHDEGLFTRKLLLRRKIELRLDRDEILLVDSVENRGDRKEPFQILYHFNIGYPLLDEDSEVAIASDSVRPKDELAAAGLADRLRMEVPQPGYAERVFFHSCRTVGSASVLQPKSGVRVTIAFDPSQLDRLTEWKMMGVHDYVLGLEPGNCFPEGRAETRRCGDLRFLEPGESVEFALRILVAQDATSTRRDAAR